MLLNDEGALFVESSVVARCLFALVAYVIYFLLSVLMCDVLIIIRLFIIYVSFSKLLTYFNLKAYPFSNYPRGRVNTFKIEYGV